jgi:hypothetical protein
MSKSNNFFDVTTFLPRQDQNPSLWAQQVTGSSNMPEVERSPSRLQLRDELTT